MLSSGFEVVAIRHLCFVLATTWFVFAYRDVWPFATYTLEPVDSRYGIWLYVYFAVLSIAGVVVPLGVPRAYIPADPKVCVHIVVARAKTDFFGTLASVRRASSRADGIHILEDGLYLSRPSHLSSQSCGAPGIRPATSTAGL